MGEKGNVWCWIKLAANDLEGIASIWRSQVTPSLSSSRKLGGMLCKRGALLPVYSLSLMRIELNVRSGFQEKQMT